MTKKIQNKNLCGTDFHDRDGSLVHVDEFGVAEVSDKLAELLLGSKGWSPVRSPKKAPAAEPEPAEEPAETPEPTETPEEEEEAAEGEQEASDDSPEDPEEDAPEEVPAYEDWDYADLLAEVALRSEQDDFVEASSRKKDDLIAALELDDTKS